MCRSSVCCVKPLRGIHSKAASAGAVVAALTTGVYVAVIVQEGDNSFWSVAPWVVVMLIGTFAALAAALVRTPRLGQACAIAAVAVLGGIGLLAILSVGIGFLVAAGLVCATAVSYSPSAQPS